MDLGGAIQLPFPFLRRICPGPPHFSGVGLELAALVSSLKLPCQLLEVGYLAMSFPHLWSWKDNVSEAGPDKLELWLIEIWDQKGLRKGNRKSDHKAEEHGPGVEEQEPLLGFKGGAINIGISSEEPKPAEHPTLFELHVSLVLILDSTFMASQTAPSGRTTEDRNVHVAVGTDLGPLGI